MNTKKPKIVKDIIKEVAELGTLNKKLIHQNNQKEKRIAELMVINKNLINQNSEKVNILKNNKQTISHQDELIGKLTRRIEFLEDSEAKRQHWLEVAKRDAGYDARISFDKVWAETLHKAKQNEKKGN